MVVNLYIIIQQDNICIIKWRIMKSNKTDNRSRYTQMIIKKSLLKLSEKKPLNKITVSELCLDAGTNRITFYNHFYDIYDVYETIENDFYEEIMAKLENMKIYDIETYLIKEIILQLYRNADICNLFINSKSDFIPRLLSAIQEKCVSEISARYKKIPLDILNSLYIFLINGYFGLMIDWVKSGMEQSPEEISNLIGTFNKFTLDGITNHYEK